MHFTPSTIPDEAVKGIAPGFDKFGLHDASEWVQRCKDNLAQLWNIGECWAVTEVFPSKAGLICHIVALAGGQWRPVVDEIEEWAKSVGCTRVHFTGREGWAKVLPDYETVAVVRQKVIT